MILVHSNVAHQRTMSPRLYPKLIPESLIYHQSLRLFPFQRDGGREKEGLCEREREGVKRESIEREGERRERE